jgi:hypothetical protein
MVGGMMEFQGNTDPLFHGWLWEMFKEYVRKIRRTASSGAPTLEEMRESYRRIFRDSSIKILVEEKVGMIVVFNDLEERTTAQLDGMLEEPALIEYLSETYGRGKFKINLYHGMTFVATKNFKVLNEDLSERWREIVARKKSKEEE